MAKKRSTQVIEFLVSLHVTSTGVVEMSAEKRDWCVQTLKVIDQRDEQRQKRRRKAKKAGR